MIYKSPYCCMINRIRILCKVTQNVLKEKVVTQLICFNFVALCPCYSLYWVKYHPDTKKELTMFACFTLNSAGTRC